MATCSDIVARAARKLQIIQKGDTLTAEEAADGLDDLNMMLAAWKLHAVDIEHTALELTDDFPLLPEFEEGTVYMLALRMGPDYALPPQFNEREFFDAIRAAYMVIAPATMDDGLLRMPSAYLYNNGRYGD